MRRLENQFNISQFNTLLTNQLNREQPPLVSRLHLRSDAFHSFGCCVYVYHARTRQRAAPLQPAPAVSEWHDSTSVRNEDTLRKKKKKVAKSIRRSLNFEVFLDEGKLVFLQYVRLACPKLVNDQPGDVRARAYGRLISLYMYVPETFGSG